jgi:hypothetical protein
MNNQSSNNSNNLPPPPPVLPQPPPSSDMQPLPSETEDPVTPKTIHMSSSNNMIAGMATTITKNNNGQPPLAPPSLSLQATSDDSSSFTPSSYLQRSIPVHKRSHYYHSSNNHTNQNNSNTTMSYHGYSVTSSTRSVKSVGSSILDTEDEDKSQTGISFMSQDYNIDEKSVLSREIPRIVPRGASSSRIGVVTGANRSIPNGDEDDADLDMDEEDDEVGCEEEDNNNDDDDDNSDIPTSNLTVGIMGKYMKEIQISMERGLREIKQQNQRDHEKGKYDK